MLWPAVVFAVLAAVFGVWAFHPAGRLAWPGARVLFWVFVLLFLLSVPTGRRPRRRLP
jgi:uncharacterized membrane protein YtjA (UPF0391 family)